MQKPRDTLKLRQWCIRKRGEGALAKPRMKRTYLRWQRMRPNSLWQCDLKLVGDRWLVTILDDHSRFVTGSKIFNEGTAKNVISLFDQAIDEHSKPREILTDHGSQFWSVRKGELSFDMYCEQHGIKHILGGIGKPTTQGKNERWFRNLRPRTRPIPTPPEIHRILQLGTTAHGVKLFNTSRSLLRKCAICPGITHNGN